MMKYSAFSLLLVLALRAANYAAAQSGFISIDCGLRENSDYIDSETGISYTSDSGFISSGVNKPISPEYTDSLESQFLNVRSFPEGTRNCYTLRPDQGKDGKYLIRLRFLYGNYDAASKPPKFDVYLGLEYWDTLDLETVEYDSSYSWESIHIPLSDYINVCLVKTGPGTPFISSLELRPLDTEMYPIAPGFMDLYRRYKYNSRTNLTIRYKDDIHDRRWRPEQLPSTTTLSTTSTINTSIIYDLPQAAMSSAATPTNSSSPLSISWFPYHDVKEKFHVYLHFTELQELQPNQSRQFDVYINNVLNMEYYTPKYQLATTVHTTTPLTNETEYVITLNKSINSTLPPIINAAEVYWFKAFSLPQTIEGDVVAMSSIKSTYEITKNWQGDPCGPDKFEWDGVTCNTRDGFDPRRIISLNLSFHGLNGTIASSILNLTMLQNLDLSNNNLSGLVPEFLNRMASLQVLNMKGNNFTSCPPELLEKQKQGKLQFSCDDRGAPPAPPTPPTCQSDSCKKKEKSVVPVVASVVGAVLFVLVALLIAFFVFRRKKQRAMRKVETQSNRNEGIVETISPNNNEYVIVGTKSRQFTYHEVLSMTNNFQRVIGKGGFGTVYHGYVGKTQVAVKMLSQSSTQGYKEFQAEANLLLTIHHKNLTSLVGYCYEGTNMGIVYEYMANGNVEKHLLGKGPYVLTWEERLRIAIDAGQGLEYLHHGCIPPVVHRDVKTTNILLDEKFQAKLADFGLSRAFPIDDGTQQISTMVAGTPGYLDPEYCSTTRLTEKSDVYSFGIVLMEVVTGRSALPRNQTEAHIITWISSELEKGDIENIIDPRLQKDYAINSVWKIVELAMACVARNSSKRPTMHSVVVELMACLEIEISRNDIQPNDSIGVIPMRLQSGLGPQAR